MKEIEQKQIVLVSGKSEITLKGKDAEQYPRIQEISASNPLTLPIQTLKKIISETAFAASTQESRPILTGVHFVLSDHKELKTVATDSHRMSQKNITLEKNGDNFDVVIPSTEINLISNGELKNSRSYNIGTVRMLSGMVKEEEKEALRTDLIGLAAEYAPISIIGSGGNINKLFRLADKKDKKASLLPVESLREIYEALQALPAEQRIEQYKLKPDRADVIVPAAEIFLEVATNVKATGIIVPTIGLSDGIIDSLYTQKMNTPVTPQIQ